MTKYSGLTAAAAGLTTHQWGVNEGGASKVVTAAQVIALVAQGTLPSGYAQVTANQGTFTAVTDLTSLTVTVTPVSAGRRLRVSCFATFSSSVAADIAQLYIREGATTLQVVNLYLANNSAGFGASLSVVLTPTFVAHTYKLSGARGSGTGNITMNASATDPAYILVEDVGV